MSFPKPSLPRSLRHPVFWPPFGLLLVCGVWSLVDADGFFSAASAANSFLLDRFASAYAGGALFFLLTTVALYVSPVGAIRIGGPDAKPLMGRLPWFAITLCTTIAIGILFWGVAEPLFHYHAPPAFGGVEPESPGARRFALSTLFLHWSFTPYAMYALAAVLFALMYYNRQQPFRLASMLVPVFGRRAHGPFSSVLDGVCLFCLVAGMATNLGVGMLVLSGGLTRFTGLPAGPLSFGLVGGAIVAAFLISSITGLLRGIRILSLWNLGFFLALLGFVAWVTPWSAISRDFLPAMAEYASGFWPKHGMNGLAAEGWSQDWTIFYWANWLAWTPITALFLGRLGVGRTVREFLRVNLIYPALFAIAWMAVFGGAGLYFDGPEGSLFAGVESQGPQAAMFALFDRLPGAEVVAILFLFIAFLSYTTAADSNTSAMGALSSTGISPASPEPATGIKLAWGLLVGLMAWVMVSFAGLDGLRMASNLGGLPALLLEFFLAFGAWRLMFRPALARFDPPRKTG